MLCMCKIIEAVLKYCKLISSFQNLLLLIMLQELHILQDMIAVVVIETILEISCPASNYAFKATLRAPLLFNFK
jgi:hypothetical protein